MGEPNDEAVLPFFIGIGVFLYLSFHWGIARPGIHRGSGTLPEHSGTA